MSHPSFIVGLCRIFQRTLLSPSYQKPKFCQWAGVWYNIAMKNNSLFWDIYAKLYDTLNLLEPYQRLHREVLQSLELKGGERILDAGCGTGNFEKLLSGKGISNKSRYEF